MKLVPNWKNGWRWLSVHLMVLGGAIQGAWVAFPDSIRFGRGVDEVEPWRSDAGTSTDDLAESTPSCS